MKKNLITLAVLTTFCLTSCKEKEVEKVTEIVKEEVKAPIDVTGVYEGIIPCADCSGISQKLTLNADETFVLESIYQGKNDEKPIVETGTFEAMNGELALLTNNTTSMYKIEKEYVEKLDLKGHKIESSLNYKLMKK